MTTTLYEPENLSRWSLPRDYIGSHWDGYYLAPVGRHRDSDLLTKSNWGQQWEALKALRQDVPDEDCVSPVVVSENHWAVGWVEWVAIHETNEAALREADSLAASLESYPVLDDGDFSEKESEAYDEAWKFYGCREFADALAGAFALAYDTKEFLRDADDEAMRELYESLVPSGEYYVPEGDGVSICIHSAIRTVERQPGCRKMLADFIRKLRND